MVALRIGHRALTIALAAALGLVGLGLSSTRGAEPGTPSVVSRYAPLVYLHPDEALLPYSADTYFQNSLEYRVGEDHYLDAPDQILGGLPVGSAPGDAAEYEQGRYIIYWFFYAADRQWLAGDDTGTVKVHEGDWEHVVIRLDSADEPVAIAYYQHECDPRIFAWEELDGHEPFGSWTGFWGETHPIVYSALGSHASYWGPRRRAEPIGTSCPSIIRDLRGDAAQKGAAWKTWAGAGLVDARAQGWYDYLGLWGPPSADPLSLDPGDSGIERFPWSSGGRGPSASRFEPPGRVIPDGWEHPIEPDAAGTDRGATAASLEKAAALAEAARQTISAGSTHTCVLRPSGTVWCWGANGSGQLGDGTKNERDAPVAVGRMPDAVAISAGGAHTCALRDGGTVLCWGSNDHGQLGDGSTEERALAVPVKGLSGVKAITAGGSHSCALRTNGSVWCWGANFYGQLGDGTRFVDRHTPVRVNGLSGVTAISAGGSHSCALRANGSVWCWGHNFYGQLGGWSDFIGFGEPDLLEPVKVKGITGARAIGAGGEFTCALRSNGRVSCFGGSDRGIRGSQPRTGWHPPPSRIVGIGDGVAIAAGGYHACVLRAIGTIRCWGSNSNGQLGGPQPRERGQPVEVTGLVAVTAVAAGSKHTCAQQSDGSVWCWGHDGYGQVGDGDGRNAGSPASVMLPDTGSVAEPEKEEETVPAVPANSLALPVEGDLTWTVCRGYNVETHSNRQVYGLDLTAASGQHVSSGCWAGPDASGNGTVLAPVTGVVAWFDSYDADDDLVCINRLDEAGGGSVLLGHIRPRSAIEIGVEVTAGTTVLGDVLPLSASSRSGYAHIHIAAFEGRGCTSPVPFEGRFEFECVGPLPADGSANQHQGRTFAPC